MRISTGHIVFIILFVTSSISTYAQVINAGVRGNTAVDLLERLNDDVLIKSPDLVIVMVGTNDMLNSKKLVSYQAYEDYLERMVIRIKQMKSNVVLMTSPPADSVYLFKRHDKKLFKESPNMKLDSARNRVHHVAKKLSVHYLDLFQVFNDMNLPKHNSDLFFKNSSNSGAADGVHPTALGYRFIGEFVFRYLKENLLLKNPQKIICLGDSITYGSGMVGRGTATGDTYPAVLQDFINNEYNSINRPSKN